MRPDDADSAEAWVRSYLEHRRALGVYALALTGDAADAHDLLQDVLLKLVRSGATPDNRRAYVMRCLRSAAADRRKARRLRSVDDEGLDPAFLDGGAGDVEMRETVALVQAALRGLPAPQREVIVLKIYGELTFQEVAEVLSRPVGSVASAYARGLAALRAALGAEVEHVQRND